MAVDIVFKFTKLTFTEGTGKRVVRSDRKQQKEKYSGYPKYESKLYKYLSKDLSISLQQCSETGGWWLADSRNVCTMSGLSKVKHSPFLFLL